jgi:hypothetical protein
MFDYYEFPMAPAVAQTCHPELSRRGAFEALKAELSAKRGLALPSAEGLIATAIPELDRLLGGGFPPGIVATLEGETGRWSLAARLIARMTRRGLAAILDDGTLYPPSLARAGARLERILVVPARTPLGAARAADILLRSRICRLILMPAVALRDSMWARLAKLAHHSGTLLIVMTLRASAALAAAAGVRLHCALERAVVSGTRGLWGTLKGFELCVGVRKHRRAPCGHTTHIRVAHEGMGSAALC